MTRRRARPRVARRPPLHIRPGLAKARRGACPCVRRQVAVRLGPPSPVCCVSRLGSNSEAHRRGVRRLAPRVFCALRLRPPNSAGSTGRTRNATTRGSHERLHIRVWPSPPSPAGLVLVHPGRRWAMLCAVPGMPRARRATDSDVIKGTSRRKGNAKGICL